MPVLLSLPNELLQRILEYCEVSAFIQIAYCSKRLLEQARSTRRLVLHQLKQLPGRPASNWGYLDTSGLFCDLLKRSHEVLIGAEFRSERKIITFQGKVIDHQASSLKDLATQKKALLAFEDDPTVYVVHIKQNGTMTFHQRLELPAAKHGNVKVLHTAFDGDAAIYVLHRVQPFIDPELDPSHPFVKQAVQSNLRGGIFLARYDLSYVHRMAVHIYGFPDQVNQEPLCFAAHGRRFAISWQHVHSAQNYEVVLYTMEGSENESQDPDDENTLVSRYSSYTLSESNGGGSGGNAPPGPAVRLAFNDRGSQLLQQYRAQTLYGSFQRILVLPHPGEEQPHLNLNGCVVQFTDNLSLRFAIAIPFFATHQAGTDAAGSRCRWQYLAVGIATHRVDGWSVACLLRSEGSPLASRCLHLTNLERGRRFDDWQVMAQLGGFQEASTSQGSLIAASPRGTRIAMASWKTLTFWVLQPHEVILEDSDFYPESWRSEEGRIVLQPFTIQVDAVCYQLQFINENEMAAITDRGLLLLHLKSNGRVQTQVWNHHGNTIPGVTEEEG